MTTTDPTPADQHKRTICLCMIVKDEAAIIERCLSSVTALVDHWVVCDTGSTDDTVDLVCRMLKDLPGSLHRRPWVNFGVNRSEVLDLARGKADYLFMLDADMTAHYEPSAKMGLSADAYLLRYTGELDFRQKLLISSRRPYRYVGATHEHIEIDGPERVEFLDSISVTHHADGQARPTKLMRDLAILSRSLVADPDNVRTVFYLAQTYRDLGRFEEAAEQYERRAQMGGWDEEVFYSLYQSALIAAQEMDDWGQALTSFIRAWEFRPSRLEPIYHIVRRLRRRKEYHTAIVFAQPALAQPYPSRDVLFVHRWMYTYGLPLEYVFCCVEVGLSEHAVAVCDAVLARDDIPSHAREEAAKLREKANTRSGRR